MDDFRQSEAERIDIETALACYPGAKPEDRKSHLEYLTELRRHHGTWRFQLMHGMRFPTNRVEVWELEFLQAMVSLKELDRQSSPHARHAVDHQMIEKLYRVLESQVDLFSRAQKNIEALIFIRYSGRKADEIEAEVNQFLTQINCISPLQCSELRTMVSFLQGIRLTRNMGLATAVKCSAASAVQLALNTFHRALDEWTELVAHVDAIPIDSLFLYSNPEPEALWKKSILELPIAGELLAQLEYEKSAALLELKTRPNAKAKRLQIEKWSDLAIAIDQNNSFWALHPRPEYGDRVLKSKAVNLTLPQTPWRDMLIEFARSESGGILKIGDMFRLLDALLPPADEVTAAQVKTVELGILTGEQRKPLRDKLKVLRRILGNLIECPCTKDTTCLRLIDEGVESRFATACGQITETAAKFFGNETLDLL